MNYIEAVIIGIVQGLAEFLPVSSSGHLALFQKLFGLNSDTISITLVAHLGTLFAIIFFYQPEFTKIFKDLFKSRTSLLVNPTIRLISLVIVATIPAIIMGIFFRESIDAFYQSYKWLGLFFLFTSMILLLSKLKSTEYNSMSTNTEYISHQITYSQALLIGLSQAIAIFPGISRTGITITTGLFVGLKKQNAAFFSFLISIPAIVVTAILELRYISEIESPGSMITLFLTSFIFGFVGIWSLIFILRRGKLYCFSFYLIPLSIFMLYYLS